MAHGKSNKRIKQMFKEIDLDHLLDPQQNKEQQKNKKQSEEKK